MHEMSIAANILEIAERRAAEADARVIHRIEVQVGRLAGVEIPSLEFCFATARRFSGPAAGAVLEIEAVEGRGRCRGCGREFPIDFPVAVCPGCGAAGVEILQGRELKVCRINVD